MKDFIQKNKSDFESEKPSAGLWDKIEAELAPVEEGKVVKMIPVKRVWKMAVAAVTVFAVSLLAIQYSNEGGNEIAEVIQDIENFSSVNQLENYYSVQVNDRIEKLKMYEVDEELLGEIKLLKDEFEELKNEAGKGLNQEDILDSMIDNYRLRVSILEDIMREVQRKSETNEENVIQ